MYGIFDDYPVLSDMEKYDTIFSTEYLGQNSEYINHFIDIIRMKMNFIGWKNYKLEMYNEQNHTLFNFPSVPNTKDLLNAAMHQKSNVEDFYKKLMG